MRKELAVLEESEKRRARERKKGMVGIYEESGKMWMDSLYRSLAQKKKTKKKKRYEREVSVIYYFYLSKRNVAG